MRPLTHRWASMTILALILPVLTIFTLAQASGPSAPGPDLVVADATALPPTLDPFRVYGTQAQSFFRLIFEPLFDRICGRQDSHASPRGMGRRGPAHLGVSPAARRALSRRGRADRSRRRVLPRADPGRQLGAAARIRRVDTITAVDPLTVRITTKGPYALLPARLSQFSMILPDQLRGRPEADFFREPVGLGPFRLAELSRSRRCSPRSRLPRRRAEGLAGRLPVHPGCGGASEPAVSGRSTSSRTSCRSRWIPAPGAGRPPGQAQLDPVHGRVHRQPPGPSGSRRGPSGAAPWHGRRGPGPVHRPRQWPTRSPTVTLPEDFGFHASLKPYPFDPAKARALLAEAGYPDGFRLQGLATHDTQTLATALAQQWAKLGVKLDVTVEGRAPTMPGGSRNGIDTTS